MFRIKDNLILSNETGEIICATTPKFEGWTFDDYVEEYDTTKEVRYLDPMTAQELDGEELDTYINERLCIAEEKYDGHRALLYFTSKGVRVFSRRVSKETGWFKENTDQLPHIRDLYIPEELIGTVVDGEILLPVKDCTCREVQSVTGALPAKAIEYQLQNGFAFCNCFDILFYKGKNCMALPLWRRKIYLFNTLNKMKASYLRPCPMYIRQNDFEELLNILPSCGEFTEDFLSLFSVTNDLYSIFDLFISEGKEGLMIKDLMARYEQKRTKSYIKMKPHLTFDVVITGYEEPTKVYDGKEIDSWEYWIDDNTGELVSTEEMPIPPCREAVQYGYTPVTKFYAMNWIGAIKFGVWKDGELIEIGQTSGMDEATRQLISENREEFLGKVIEVEAQRIIDKETGSLQHPRFVRLREDKSSDMCTFEAHIRKG